MNKIFLLFCSVVFLSSTLLNSATSSIKDSDLVYQNTKSDYNGVWVLSNYMDSILNNKKIAEYRLLKPSWFAIVVKIVDKKIYTFGSIDDHVYDLELRNSENDTLCELSHLGGTWVLTKNQKKNKLELKLVKGFKDEVDTTLYTYAKSDDLLHLTENLKEFVPKTESNFIRFFSKKFFVGDYTIISPKDRKGDAVYFYEEGNTNFENFENYEPNIYFGTQHPFNNKDVISFSREYKIDVKYWYQFYNWRFNNDTLILRPYHINDDKGAGWELGNEEIRLLKHNK